MDRFCTIEIKDEVNCQIKGLEPSVLRKCVKALEFFLPYAKHTPAYKLGRWNGCVNYFTTGGVTQVNLLDKIMPILDAEGYDVEINDKRQQYDLQFPLIDANIINHIKWPANHPTKAGENIVLDDHQVTTINNFLQNLQSIQIVATGAGKTIMTAILSMLLEKYGRTITIVPNKQLVHQTLEDYKLLGLDAGVYYGEHKDLDKMHTIATWQSIDHLIKDSKKDEDAAIKLEKLTTDIIGVIGDEVHGAKADALRLILLKYLNHVPIRFGLTGTLPKEDHFKYSIISCIGNVVGEVKTKDLQDKGFLANCEIHILQIQDTKKFKTYPEERDYLLNNTDRQKLIANLIKNIGQTGNTLTLIELVDPGKSLTELIPMSVFIDGSMKVQDRKKEYDAVASSMSKDIIATFGVASTGINVPNIRNLIGIEFGKSFIKVIQSLGRALRRTTEKDFTTIYDICSSCKYSKKHLTERKKFYKEQGFPFQVIKIDPNFYQE